MTDEVSAIIYNDGIPSCTFQGSESEFLHTISDETIDYAFPPSAEEAAELEAVEVFVDLMATLAYLEEKEEATRNNDLGNGLGKRWAARRELVGRPHPAVHSIEPATHYGHTTHKKNKNETMTDLVETSQQHIHIRQEQEMARLMLNKAAAAAAAAGKHQYNTKGAVNKHAAHKHIQQPRKQN